MGTFHARRQRLTVRHALARDWPTEVGGRKVNVWKLAEPKTTRSRRTLDLPDIAVRALRRQHLRQEAMHEAAGGAWQDVHRLVFTDSVGRPLRGYDVNAAFGKMLRAAGLPRIPFHGLRHSNATALLAAGVPLKVVADQLGHSTITLTANTYGGVVPELRREAAEAIDRALGANRP